MKLEASEKNSLTEDEFEDMAATQKYDDDDDEYGFGSEEQSESDDE